MPESSPPAAGQAPRDPKFWLLAVGGLVALLAMGLFIRSVGDDGEDANATTVAAVASVTATPEATPTPTPTAAPTASPTSTPSPTATTTAAPDLTPTPTDTPTATPTQTESAQAADAPSAAPTRPAAPPAGDPTPPTTETPSATPTEEPTEAPSATPEPTETSTSGQGSAGDASHAYAETDRIRSAAGAAPISSNGSLAAVAQAWSQKMRDNGSLSHNPNTPGEIPSGWSLWGENVAWASSVAEAMRLLEGSAPHYANIVNSSFTDVGIGVIVDSDGWVWVTQVFAAY